MLTFDAALHEYRWNGVVKRSVTQVLDDAGMYDFGGADPAALAFGRERGSQVHRICELNDKDDLVESSVDESLVGYLEAWRRFCREQVELIVANEHKVYNAAHDYAGTLDRVLVLRALGLTLGDLKTGQPQRATGPQTAAYQQALPKAERPPKRIAIYLQEDGRYNVMPHDDRNDFIVFTAALAKVRAQNILSNWKAQK